MTQLLRCTCAAVLFLVFAGLLSAAETYKGKLVSAGNGKITFTDTQNEEHTFDVSEGAKITRDGKAAVLADLEESDSVEITTKKTGTKTIATAVAARSKE